METKRLSIVTETSYLAVLLENEVVGELKLVEFTWVTPEYDVVVAVARDTSAMDSVGLRRVVLGFCVCDVLLVEGERTIWLSLCSCKALLGEVFCMDGLLTMY